MHKEQVPLPNIFQYFDGKENICKTSYSKVIKGELPCQAVVNNMYVHEIPTQLASLEKTVKYQFCRYNLPTERKLF